MESIYTGAQPPERLNRLDVHRVVTPESQEFVVLSPAIYGQWVHWFGRRSSECCQDRSTCKGCKENWPVYWKGYLHVLTDNGKRQIFLELTKNACEEVALQAHKGQDLRGILLSVRKTKGGAKGRYVIVIRERRLAGADLPAPMDPLMTLRRLWNAKKNPGHCA